MDLKEEDRMIKYSALIAMINGAKGTLRENMDIVKRGIDARAKAKGIEIE